MREEYINLKSKRAKKIFTFAVVSDLHNDYRLDFIDQMKGVDLILCPGDMVNHGHNESQNAILFFKSAINIAPVCYSIGNHEDNFEPYYDKVRSLGVFVLNGGSACVNILPRVAVGGIARLNDEMYLETLDSLEQFDGFRILLCHRPELFSQGLDKRNIDLIVSGHAHGGQIRFMGKPLYAPGQGLFPKYVDGLYENMLLVSSGVSNPIKFVPRIGNPPKLYFVSVIPI